MKRLDKLIIDLFVWRLKKMGTFFFRTPDCKAYKKFHIHKVHRYGKPYNDPNSYEWCIDLEGQTTMDKLETLREYIEEKIEYPVFMLESDYFRKGYIAACENILSKLDKIADKSRDYIIINGKKYKLTEVEE